MSEISQIRAISYQLSHQTLTASVHPATDLFMLPSMRAFIFRVRHIISDISLENVKKVVFLRTAGEILHALCSGIYCTAVGLVGVICVI